MRLTPLVNLAKLRVPAMTDVFGDVLAVASMVVVSGGSITLTCSAGHGIPVGRTDWVSITDALTPNPITGLVKQPNGDVLVTVQYPHNLTGLTSETLNRFAAYQGFATLSVPGTALLTDACYLVSVPSRTTFVVRPAGSVTIPAPMPADAALIEALEGSITGLNIATATSATVLTMPTPANVDRSYTVVSPKVARNLRIFGAVDLAHAMTHWTDMSPAPGCAVLFVCPRRKVTLSRDRASRSDLDTEFGPNQVFRQMLADGFELYAFLWTQSMAAAVGAVDKANDEILTAIMRTFNGIRIPFSEFAGEGTYAAVMTSHGVEAYNKTSYVHAYVFEAGIQLTSGDLAPDYKANIAALFDPAFDPADPVQPIGTWPIDSIAIEGIYHDIETAPQPLEATISINSD